MQKATVLQQTWGKSIKRELRLFAVLREEEQQLFFLKAKEFRVFFKFRKKDVGDGGEENMIKLYL